MSHPVSCSWHGPSPLIEPDWSGAAAAALTPGSNYVAFMVRGDKQQAVYVGFNPNPEPCAVSLPNPGLRMQWRRLVDTARCVWGGVVCWVLMSKMACVANWGVQRVHTTPSC